METNGVGLYDFSLYNICLRLMVAKAIVLNLNFCLHQVISGFRQRLTPSTRIMYRTDPRHLRKCEKRVRSISTTTVPSWNWKFWFIFSTSRGCNKALLRVNTCPYGWLLERLAHSSNAIWQNISRGLSRPPLSLV